MPVEVEEQLTAALYASAVAAGQVGDGHVLCQFVIVGFWQSLDDEDPVRYTLLTSPDCPEHAALGLLGVAERIVTDDAGGV